MSNALSAKGTGGILQTIIVSYVYSALSAAVYYVPNIGGLDFITNLNTTHTLNAFIILTNKREGFGAFLPW